jgi:prephenate dehydrogenase
MLEKQLEQIDRDLIELLGKRIAILASEAKLATPSLEKQLANAMPVLAQAGIPEFLWQSLVTCCTAASVDTSLPLTSIGSKQITIIGGRGLMGKFFAQWLSRLGHRVNILDRDDWNRANELLNAVDLVLICVPLDKMPEVIQDAAKYLGKTVAIVDVASIKAPIMQAMLEHHQGPVLGLHPMFGAGIESFQSQNVAVCPGREHHRFQWLLDRIERDGGKLVMCTAEEHDRMMTAIQAIRHFATFSLGVFLSAESIDLSRSLEVASPPYRIEIGAIGRLFSHSASLPVDIMLATKERREAIARLAKTYTQLAQLVSNEDRDALIRKFEAVRDVFLPKVTCTSKESTHLINSLSTLLAAQRVSETARLPIEA